MARCRWYLAVSFCDDLPPGRNEEKTDVLSTLSEKKVPIPPFFLPFPDSKKKKGPEIVCHIHAMACSLKLLGRMLYLDGLYS